MNTLPYIGWYRSGIGRDVARIMLSIRAGGYEYNPMCTYQGLDLQLLPHSMGHDKLKKS